MPVLIEDVDGPAGAMAGRWPTFTQGAALVGARAVFAFPLRIGSVTVGALDLYRAEPGSLSPNELSGGLMAAQAAAISLLHLETTAEDAFSDDGTARARYQMQVHQATGMVKVQVGVSIEDAFLMLRARAFSTERSLAHVARDVVERRLRFSAEDL